LPSIQAAAERATVRADRAILRLGLRTLVVAGFAGAAWLLCANAAQAADAPATDRTTDLSTVDLVRSVDVGRAPASPARSSDRTTSTALVSPVTEAVTSAHQPVLGFAAARLIGGSTPVGTATSVALSGATAMAAIPFGEPASTAAATGATAVPDSGRPGGAQAPAGGRGHRGPDGSGAGTGGEPADHARTGMVTGTARKLGSVLGIASFGVAGRAAGPAATSRPTWATVPLDALLRPISGWLRVAATPADAAADAALALGPLGHVGAPSAPSALSAPVRDTDARWFGLGAGGRAAAVTATRADRAVTAATNTVGTAHNLGSASRLDAGAVRTAAAPRSARPAAQRSAKRAATPVGRMGTGESPVGPVPTPTRGWAPGGSTSGSSVPSEGGAYAVAPTMVATVAAAVRRQPVAADVEVLRRDAEAPTVSPD
jgi:hypothetical protein